MVTVKFPDTQTKHRAIGFLAGRFSARIFGTGEVIVPYEALEALASENFTFTVLGRATYDQMASIRSNATSPVQ
jgi:hypothetical protein